MKPIDLFWPRCPKPGNAGDLVTPYLLDAWKIPYRHVPQAKPGKLLGCGSILRFAQREDIVWGSGIIARSNVFHPEATFLAVRGPLTRKRVLALGGKCPPVFGDPALLFPRIYKPKKRGGAGRGVVLHYCDWRNERIRSRWPQEQLICPLTSDPRKFIDRLCRFDEIVSSSLHGIIFAHAYGIPARWLRVSDSLGGDDVKFADYLLSIGEKLYEPEWPKGRIAPPKMRIDLDALVDRFPYHRKGAA